MVQIHKTVEFYKAAESILCNFYREKSFVFLQKTIETWGSVWYSKKEIWLKFANLHFLALD